MIPHDLAQEASKESKVAGDIFYLKAVLNSLNDAIEFANISMIEEGLNHLLEFTWPSRITFELLTIQKYLSVFDYDGALECVIRLKS